MPNQIGYTDATGPYFADVTTGKKATFDVQSLSADRIYTWPNNAGTVVVTVGGDLLPSADATNLLGAPTQSWLSLILAQTGSVSFYDGVDALHNYVAFSTGTGPIFSSLGAAKAATLDVSGLTASRTITVPDAAGTLTLRGNTATGSGSVVLATAPTLSNPVVGTQTAGDNSTKAASTAYADRFNGDPQFSTPTAGGTVSPTATGAQIQCFINPSGTLATLTLTLPTGTIKGQTLYATFTQIITALTVTGTNVDSKGKVTPTAAAVGDTFGWVWDSASAKWNRIV